MGLRPPQMALYMGSEGYNPADRIFHTISNRFLGSILWILFMFARENNQPHGLRYPQLVMDGVAYSKILLGRLVADMT